MIPSSPHLTLENLSRRVGSSPDDKSIIDDVSYTFDRSGIYTILGPSGAGKSSLLRLINRLDEPSGGRVVFEGKSQCDYSPCELRRQIGYLFQTPHLFPGSAAENIRYAKTDLTDKRLSELAKRAGLDEEILTGASERLSVGEKQRVSLARLLATEPTVVLLDEPTSALDPTHTEGIENLIRNLANEASVTVIMVTHSPEQALRMGGKTLLLVAGRLVEHGEVEQVVNHPNTDLGQRYRNRELR